MVFRPDKKAPIFADLKAVLSQTQLDNTTYQLLQTLIDRLVQYQAVIAEELKNAGSGGGGKPGEDGTPGPAGPQGPTGPTGPQGPPGSSNAIPHQATHQIGGNDTLLNNAWTNQPNTFGQRQVIVGGATGGWSVAPLEIQMTANPRVAFHWPGVVAAQIGMDSSGWVRTFNDPGTGYAPFASGSIVANGNLRATTGDYTHADGSQGLYMPNVHIQMFSNQYYWTNKANTGHLMMLDVNATLTVNGSVSVSAGYAGQWVNTTGYVTTAALTATSITNRGWSVLGNIRIQPDDATNNGFPFIRAAPAAHMCINATPIYLNLDLPGQAVHIYGPTTHYYPTIFGNAMYPSTNGTIDCGGSPNRWKTGYFALPALASGPAIITAGDGALYYQSSSRETKQNIRPFDLERSKAILNLAPSYFQNKGAKPEDPFVIGLMIDEIPEVLDDLVYREIRTTDLGTEKVESFYYDRVAMHLLVVMKDMSRRIEELETARGI